VHLQTTPNARTGVPVKPSTAARRHKGLRIDFNWAVEEREVAVSPMQKVKPPPYAARQ
jgi:hypothetical protein